MAAEPVLVRHPLPVGSKDAVPGFKEPPLPFGDAADRLFRAPELGDADFAPSADATSSASPSPSPSPSPPLPEPLLVGEHCSLAPLSAAHVPSLYASFSALRDGATTREGQDGVFEYLPVGPFASEEELEAFVRQKRRDPVFYFFAVLVKGAAVGFLSLMRADTKASSIETGFVTFGSPLQRTTAATEAFFLLLKYSFDAGYRRHEWKCDACNLPSRRAAQRLGFSYEGLFRHAHVVKGRNRDTAWFGLTREDWVKEGDAGLGAAFARFLAADNFDADGRQRVGLSELTRPLLYATDPYLDHLATQKS